MEKEDNQLEILKIGDLLLQSSKYDVWQLKEIFLEMCKREEFKSFMNNFNKNRSINGLSYIE